MSDCKPSLCQLPSQPRLKPVRVRQNTKLLLLLMVVGRTVAGVSV